LGRKKTGKAKRAQKILGREKGTSIFWRKQPQEGGEGGEVFWGLDVRPGLRGLE